MKKIILGLIAFTIVVILQIVFIYLNFVGTVDWGWAIIAIPSFIFLGIIVLLILFGLFFLYYITYRVIH